MNHDCPPNGYSTVGGGGGAYTGLFGFGEPKLECRSDVGGCEERMPAALRACPEHSRSVATDERGSLRIGTDLQSDLRRSVTIRVLCGPLPLPIPAARARGSHESQSRSHPRASRWRNGPCPGTEPRP